MNVGDLEVLPVLDGVGYEVARNVLRRAGAGDADPGAGDADPWACHSGQLDSRGRLEFTLGGFLVRAGGRVILVDAGAGTIDNGQYKGGQLLASLRGYGVAPADVTDVVFTHLHFDHVGWAAAKGEVVFRNATYRVHEADWAYFVESPDAAAGAVRKLSPVKAQLETFSGECTLAPGLDARPVGGHTPGSTIYILSSGTQRALLLGDVVHSVVELIEPGWRFTFDVDLAAAAAVRQQLSAELLDSQAPAAAAHFPGLGFGRVVTAEAGREWIFV
ncbi:MAG TPA: MBL fold metallo-hydrolase [Streptosporangiaceae bacterium]|nr:MBL fold metallo-hydrolase [Streptosporangiaceae bacterium]